ncbi:MAG TPA: hypothetical protein VHX44_06755, partial [Planctomycetota bacterium]|nr:hypothetical protein [Planctomycetota bacterium]
MTPSAWTCVPKRLRVIYYAIALLTMVLSLLAQCIITAGRNDLDPRLAVITVACWICFVFVTVRVGRRLSRARAGQCVDCGYDLRATP